MMRLLDWDHRLSMFLQECASREYKFEKYNCGDLWAGAYFSMTGQDLPMPEYKDLRKLRKALKEKSIEERADDFLVRCNELVPPRGSLVLRGTGDPLEFSCGIMVSEQALFLGKERGLMNDYVEREDKCWYV